VKVGDEALFVEVSVTESSIEVAASNYYDGSTAVLVVNDAAAMSLECG